MTLGAVELALGLGAAALALAAAREARRRWVVAQPDEWLLRVRDGRLRQAGVGIAAFRRPGELVVRFSSTLQRVGFEAHGLTSEGLPVQVDGFVFWAVAAEGDAPFRAFQQLGLANLVAPPAELKHPKHLLTSPQHKALQQLVVATVQRAVAGVTLRALLLEQDALVEALRGRLTAETRALGIRIEQAQLTAARPATAALLADLSAGEQERLREAAARVRLDAQDRLRRHELELHTRKAQEEADARREREGAEARARLEVEREEGRLLEQRLLLQREAAEARQAEALLERARQEALALRAELARRAETLAREASRAEVAQARRQRREAARAFALEGVRARALARRDAARALAQVEEEKSPAVRDVELRRHVADAVGGSLKVTDGRWVSVGSESPAASLAGAITALGDALARPARSPA